MSARAIFKPRNQLLFLMRPGIFHGLPQEAKRHEGKAGAGRNAGQPVSPNPPSHEGLLTPARRASARMRAECGRDAGGGRRFGAWLSVSG